MVMPSALKVGRAEAAQGTSVSPLVVLGSYCNTSSVGNTLSAIDDAESLLIRVGSMVCMSIPAATGMATVSTCCDARAAAGLAFRLAVPEPLKLAKKEMT